MWTQAEWPRPVAILSTADYIGQCSLKITNPQTNSYTQTHTHTQIHILMHKHWQIKDTEMASRCRGGNMIQFLLDIWPTMPQRQQGLKGVYISNVCWSRTLLEINSNLISMASNWVGLRETESETGTERQVFWQWGPRKENQIELVHFHSF